MKIRRIELIENSNETKSRFVVYTLNENNEIEIQKEFTLLETAQQYAIEHLRYQPQYVAVLMPLYKPVKEEMEGDE